MPTLDHLIIIVNDLKASVEFYASILSNTGLGVEVGAREPAPTLYFNDPNKHQLEIRTYTQAVSNDIS